MFENKELAGPRVIDNAVYSITKDNEAKMSISLSRYFKKKKHYLIEAHVVTHYIVLVVLALLTWGLLWSIFGDGWALGGPWLTMAGVALLAWSSGLLLQRLTTLPPLLAALIVGILARNLHILDMSDHPEIDSLLRKVYPVIILGKASLGWNTDFMKKQWKVIATLGSIPWLSEVAAVAVCTHFLLDFPWLWGILLGSIYSSVSCAVVMPSVIRNQQKYESRLNWPQLVCTAGGIDTGLSVGVYGIVFSLMFTEASTIYKYTKVVLTLFVGVILGVAWGSLAKFLPHRDDPFVTELRVLFVLGGGLFGNFFTLLAGWGGVGGVAVLACNATAALHWSREGWTLNKNPAATTYRVLWSACEPALFAYTGTFFKIDSSIRDTMILGLAVLAICLIVRFIVTWLVAFDLTWREKLYVCCSSVPKSIVEAVLCPLAIDTLLMKDMNHPELKHAENLMRLIVQAILISTPIGFLLTDRIIPLLISQKSSLDIEKVTSNKRTSSNNGVKNEDASKT